VAKSCVWLCVVCPCAEIPCGDQTTAQPAVCFLGNLTNYVEPAVTGEQVAASCTLSYTISADVTVLASDSIEGRLQYAPFPITSAISDTLDNNNVSTCVA
jgi:hypothetical protein